MNPKTRLAMSILKNQTKELMVISKSALVSPANSKQPLCPSILSSGKNRPVNIKVRNRRRSIRRIDFSPSGVCEFVIL
jgi:hypothetical protein